MKKFFHLVFHRVVIFVFLMLVQLVFLLGMMIFFNDYYAYFYAICTLASLAVVLWIVNNKRPCAPFRKTHRCWKTCLLKAERQPSRPVT